MKFQLKNYPKNILSNKNNHIFFQKILIKNIYYKYPDRKNDNK